MNNFRQSRLRPVWRPHVGTSEAGAGGGSGGVEGRPPGTRVTVGEAPPLPGAREAPWQASAWGRSRRTTPQLCPEAGAATLPIPGTEEFWGGLSAVSAVAPHVSPWALPLCLSLGCETSGQRRVKPLMGSAAAPAGKETGPPSQKEEKNHHVSRSRSAVIQESRRSTECDRRVSNQKENRVIAGKGNRVRKR